MFFRCSLSSKEQDVWVRASLYEFQKAKTLSCFHEATPQKDVSVSCWTYYTMFVQPPCIQSAQDRRAWQVIDWGLAGNFEQGRMKSSVGTSTYSAPEAELRRWVGVSVKGLGCWVFGPRFVGFFGGLRVKESWGRRGLKMLKGDRLYIAWCFWMFGFRAHVWL